MLAVTITADNLAGGFSGTVLIAYLSSLTNLSFTATQYALLSSFMSMLGKFTAGYSGNVQESIGWLGFFLVRGSARRAGYYLVVRRGKTSQTNLLVKGDEAIEIAVGKLDELSDPGCREFQIGDGDWPLHGFVVRQGDAVFAYENYCEHVGHPLNWMPDAFLTKDRSSIICASHGALYEIEQRPVLRRTLRGKVTTYRRRRCAGRRGVCQWQACSLEMRCLFGFVEKLK